ncbi:hypothetical protein HYR99_08355 [Candidatus Poribacteria bacterium]|nr:hypothetical protein [Candidatus Poribacteria bacterium]
MTTKLVFPFVEIELPPDFPDPTDLEAVHHYGLTHPEVAKRVAREYERAYRKWLKEQDGCHASAKGQPRKAKARTQ